MSSPSPKTFASGGGGGGRCNLAFGINDNIFDNANTRYLSVGESTSINIYNNEAQVQVPATSDGTLKNMYVHMNGDVGGGNRSVIFTLRVNGANTALSVTMDDLLTDNSDLVNKVAVNAGDLLSISVVPANAPNARYCHGSLEFEF